MARLHCGTGQTILGHRIVGNGVTKIVTVCRRTATGGKLVRSDSQTETATAELSELLAHRRHLAAWLHAEQRHLNNAASDEIRRVLTTQIDWLIERINGVDADLVHALQCPIRGGASSARCRKAG